MPGLCCPLVGHSPLVGALCFTFDLAESGELIYFCLCLSPTLPLRSWDSWDGTFSLLQSPMAGDTEVVSVLEWTLCSSELVVEIFISGACRPQGPGAF